MNVIDLMKQVGCVVLMFNEPLIQSHTFHFNLNDISLIELN